MKKNKLLWMKLRKAKNQEKNTCRLRRKTLANNNERTGGENILISVYCNVVKKEIINVNINNFRDVVKSV